MAFFDELKKKAQSAAFTASEKAQELASAASEKAKDAADNAKINVSIMSEQRSIEKNYRAIGEWYVSSLEGADAPEAIADIVAAVRASLAKIEQLESSRPSKESGEVIEGDIVDDGKDANS